MQHSGTHWNVAIFSTEVAFLVFRQQLRLYVAVNPAALTRGLLTRSNQNISMGTILRAPCQTTVLSILNSRRFPPGETGLHRQAAYMVSHEAKTLGEA
jgi:hypothetical protein